MRVINNPIILRDDNTEEKIEMNSIYEFTIDNYDPRTGRVINMTEREITFDCSDKYKSDVRNYELHRIQSMIKKNK